MTWNYVHSMKSNQIDMITGGIYSLENFKNLKFSDISFVFGKIKKFSWNLKKKLSL